MPLFTQPRRETVWKFLRTGQPPVVADPREGPFHHPPPRQHPETSRRHEPSPVNLIALLGPFPCPELCYFLWHRLAWLAHYLNAHAEDLLRPPPAPPLVA